MQMVWGKYFFAFILLISFCGCHRETISMEKSAENTDFSASLNVPECFCGKWRVSEYINGKFVGQDLENDILNDEIELCGDYIIYNGEILHITKITLQSNLDYYEVLTTMRYRAFEFMDKDDTAAAAYITCKSDIDNENGEEVYFTFVFVSSGDWYIGTASNWLGKMEKAE